MSSDPWQPSEEWMARMDQMRAGAREMAESLETIVSELTVKGWSVEQARTIIVAALSSGKSS